MTPLTARLIRPLLRPPLRRLPGRLPALRRARAAALSSALFAAGCATLFPALLSGCSAPYHPPVVVRGSAPFPGLADIAAGSSGAPIDLILIHGMCTRDAAWIERNVDRIAGMAATPMPQAPQASPALPPNGRIELVERTRQVGGATVRFHGVVWSPLTAELKRQLAYDNTGSPTDCAGVHECKPKRALINAALKDKLLNDCLSDVVIYESDSHDAIRDAIVETIAQVLAADAGSEAPLVVVAESLGSKMMFDALSSMLESNQPRLQALGQNAARRLGLVHMMGNQLPLLGLARDSVVAPNRAAAAPDALQRFLDLRRRQPGLAGPRPRGIAPLALVAFTDPNDLLTYRLLPGRYAAPDMAVTDVLVSNDRTWLGLLENPLTAHIDYFTNPDVGALVACGWPRARACD